MKNFLWVVVLVAAVGGWFYFNQKPPLSDDESIKIVQHQYVKNPTFAISSTYEGTAYIVTVIKDGKYNEPRLVVLKQIADLWQEQPQSLPPLTCSVIECPSDAKRVSLGGKPYVYFTTESSGSAAGSVYFNLFSVAEMHLYTMSVFGGNGNINQPQPVADDVKNNKDVYDYLVQQIAVSPKIAHTNEQNLDVNSPENANQKWQLDNDNISVAMKNYAVPVKFTYYDKNLFDSWGNTTVTGSAENNKYKLVSFFKGVVVGLDKVKNKYFIVWVPSDMYEWPTDISFVDADTVHIDSANSGPSLTVHLDTSKVTSP